MPNFNLTGYWYITYSEKETYSSPNNGDQGGFVIELKTNELNRRWHIDRYDDEQIQAIVAYKNKLEGILEQL